MIVVPVPPAVLPASRLGPSGLRAPEAGLIAGLPAVPMTDREAKAALAYCRSRIDVVDRHIVSLLNERTRIVEEIGSVKRKMQMPIYEPKREDEVFANAMAANTGPLSPEAVKRIFERIIDEMRVVQKNKMETETQC